MLRNTRPICPGMGGRFETESVADLERNTQVIMSKHKINLFSLVILLLITILFNGCASAPRIIHVDSIVSHDASLNGKKYVIASSIKNIEVNDLEFQEVARYIEKALSSKGYRKVANAENADILIAIFYGVGAPEKSYQTQTQHGMIMPIGGVLMSSPSRTQTTVITTHLTTMIVQAYSLRDANRKSPIWKTTTKHTVNRPNLRSVLPYMVAASSDYFGRDTEKEIIVEINEDDLKVQNIRK